MHNKIVTLGPQGTYSELATLNYLSQYQLDLDIEFFSSITKTLNAIGNTATLGVLPIENFSEGFVNLVLDHLISATLYIKAEVLLPIQFSLVSHCHACSEIEDIYVQFIAKGQCTDFLDDFLNCKFITTESNTQSMLAMQQNSKSAAVIPNHLLTDQNYNLVKQNITDYHNNQTRFLVFSDTTDECYAGKSADYKTSIIVLFHSDYPGYLENILSKFTQCNINLISIVSRPTRQEFGKYHFFIDLDGHQKDTNIDMALTDIQQYFNVKILGSYLKH